MKKLFIMFSLVGLFFFVGTSHVSAFTGHKSCKELGFAAAQGAQAGVMGQSTSALVTSSPNILLEGNEEVQAFYCDPS